MEADGLAGWLATVGVSAPAVRVRAEHDRAWCVRPVPPDDVEDGRDAEDAGTGGGWEVFWSEAGGRYEWTRFDDEDAACFYLFGRLVWAEALRGRSLR